MTEARADPSSADIDALAARRLAADEARIAGPAARRTSLSLGAAWREFWRHPSPWLISTFLGGAIAARAMVGGGSWWELAIPVALLALFPVIEWVVHVAILHWRPRSLGPVTIDSLLAREHRAHHADPRDLPLVFIPWRALVWLLPAYVVVAWLAMPGWPSALSLLVSVYAVKLGYEWTHYLVHSDYRPRSRWYRSVWRNHRLHHYKNEHYWFTVTSAGTADRLFGTYPADPSAVPTSPTVKALHDADAPG
jgi:sterol desaturase/sphingolipid hydroxylase (fatty acid hydroxylase superfamily)